MWKQPRGRRFMATGVRVGRGLEMAFRGRSRLPNQSFSEMRPGIERMRRDSRGSDERIEHALALRIGMHW